MVIFQSEADLLETIAQHDALVRQCVSGQISIAEFCDKYRSFHGYYALDGHESDDEERKLLEKHAHLIEPHRVITYEILGKVCSDKDAQLESYRTAGRFGTEEALRRLALVKLGA